MSLTTVKSEPGKTNGNARKRPFLSRRALDAIDDVLADGANLNHIKDLVNRDRGSPRKVPKKVKDPDYALDYFARLRYAPFETARRRAEAYFKKLDSTKAAAESVEKDSARVAQIPAEVESCYKTQFEAPTVSKDDALKFLSSPKEEPQKRVYSLTISKEPEEAETTAPAEGLSLPVPEGDLGKRYSNLRLEKENDPRSLAARIEREEDEFVRDYLQRRLSSLESAEERRLAKHRDRGIIPPLPGPAKERRLNTLLSPEQIAEEIRESEQELRAKWGPDYEAYRNLSAEVREFARSLLPKLFGRLTEFGLQYKGQLDQTVSKSLLSSVLWAVDVLGNTDKPSSEYRAKLKKAVRTSKGLGLSFSVSSHWVKKITQSCKALERQFDDLESRRVEREAKVQKPSEPAPEPKLRSFADLAAARALAKSVRRILTFVSRSSTTEAERAFDLSGEEKSTVSSLTTKLKILEARLKPKNLGTFGTSEPEQGKSYELTLADKTKPLDVVRASEFLASILSDLETAYDPEKTQAQYKDDPAGMEMYGLEGKAIIRRQDLLSEVAGLKATLKQPTESPKQSEKGKKPLFVRPNSRRKVELTQSPYSNKTETLQLTYAGSPFISAESSDGLTRPSYGLKFGLRL